MTSARSTPRDAEVGKRPEDLGGQRAARREEKMSARRRRPPGTSRTPTPCAGDSSREEMRKRRLSTSHRFPASATGLTRSATAATEHLRESEGGLTGKFDEIVGAPTGALRFVVRCAPAAQGVRGRRLEHDTEGRRRPLRWRVHDARRDFVLCTRPVPCDRMQIDARSRPQATGDPRLNRLLHQVLALTRGGLGERRGIFGGNDTDLPPASLLSCRQRRSARRLRVRTTAGMAGLLPWTGRAARRFPLARGRCRPESMCARATALCQREMVRRTASGAGTTPWSSGAFGVSSVSTPRSTATWSRPKAACYSQRARLPRPTRGCRAAGVGAACGARDLSAPAHAVSEGGEATAFRGPRCAPPRR